MGLYFYTKEGHYDAGCCSIPGQTRGYSSHLIRSGLPSIPRVVVQSSSQQHLQISARFLPQSNTCCENVSFSLFETGFIICYSAFFGNFENILNVLPCVGTSLVLLITVHLPRYYH